PEGLQAAAGRKRQARAGAGPRVRRADRRSRDGVRGEVADRNLQRDEHEAVPGPEGRLRERDRLLPAGPQGRRDLPPLRPQRLPSRRPLLEASRRARSWCLSPGLVPPGRVSVTVTPTRPERSMGLWALPDRAVERLDLGGSRGAWIRPRASALRRRLGDLS